MKGKKVIILLCLLMALSSLAFIGCSTCDHVFEELEVVSATCIKDGYTIKRCTLCKLIVTETNKADKADGHVYEGEGEVVEATCTESGYATHVCLACGEEFSIEIPALGHDYKTVGEMNGYVVNQCQRCPDQNNQPIVYTIEYNLLGGSYIPGRSNPETYTVETETFYLASPIKDGCKFLGWVWEGQHEPVEKVSIKKGSTGNKSFKAKWEGGDCEYHMLNGEEMTSNIVDSSTPGVTEFVGNNATCTQNGSGVYICEVCGKSIPVTTTKEHSLSEENIQGYEKEPNCTESGVADVMCSTCQQIIKVEVPANGHDYEVTFDKVGEKEKLILTCTVCGYIEEHEVVSRTNYVPATCKTEGSITYTCFDKDGNELSLDLVIEKMPHVLNGKCVGTLLPAGTAGVTEFTGMNATCAKNGSGFFMCEVCGGSVGVVTYVPHTFTGEIEKVEEPSCEENGLYKGHCSVCDEEVEAVIPATGHDYRAEVTVTPTKDSVGMVKITCGTKNCTHSEVCYIPNLTDGDYTITQGANGSKTYSLYLIEYDITITFVI